MSHIDDLIRDLCPDGVEYKPLGEILNYEQPGPYLVSSKEYNLSYPTPVLTAGATFILGHTNEQHGIYSASQDSPAIIFDDFTTASKWVDFPFKAKSSAMKILTSSSGDPADLRYTYYVLEALNYTPSTHSRHWISIFSNMPIAFPPRKVREYIVSTLNRFKALEAELEAELEARQNQFTYYRDHLVTGLQQVQLVPIKDIGELQRGRRFTRNDMVDEGIPAIHYGEIYTTYGYRTESTTSFVKDEIGPQLRFAQPGDVIIAAVGETVADVGTGVAWLGTTPVAYHDDSFALHHNQDPRYISHALRTSEYRRQKDRFISRAKVKRLLARGIEQIRIPLPVLDEQRRIADILDDFDALVNDLTSGIPAEIEARRKQYEYYRDRLLTFPEKK